MAGSTSANSERGSLSQKPSRAVAPNAAHPSLGNVVKGPARYIAVASALHAAALAMALSTPGQSHISVLISTGLGLCLVSLWLTYRTAGVSPIPSVVSETTAETDYESKATGALSLAPAASQDAEALSPGPQDATAPVMASPPLHGGPHSVPSRTRHLSGTARLRSHQHFQDLRRPRAGSRP